MRRCALAVAVLLGLGCAGARPPPGSTPFRDAYRDTGEVKAMDFHGWPAMAIRNSRLELVVVPAIGRIMSLGFADDRAASDPLWRHGDLAPSLAPDENGWINYGGDKAWPAPQADWERMAGKGWPPPVTFDATAHAAALKGSEIEMVSPVDPGYGLRVRRKVALLGEAAFIETTYEKVSGAPVRVAVWTITQLASPDRVFALLPERSAFANGHRRVMPAPPKELTVDGRLLGMARDTQEKTMIATDAAALLWVGPGRDLLIEAIGGDGSAAAGGRREAGGAPHPDGASAQIYTSPDGAEPYVELELLGPLVDLAPGQTATMNVRYRLIRRESADPVEEARRVFADQMGSRP